MESLQDEADRKRNLIRREDAAVAAAMGWPEVEEVDEVRQTILGDNIQIQPQQQQKSKLGTLAKLGIGAALIGTGAGIPAGASFILDALKDKPPATVPDTDSDTVGTIGFDD